MKSVATLSALPMCFDDSMLRPFIDGRLSDDEHARVAEHLGTCERCRTRVAGLALGSQSPAPASERSAPPPASESAFAIGDAIAGRYVLSHVLGRGGQSVVFEALDTETGQTVALKIFEVGSASRQRAALRELSSASRIHSPFVVRLREHLVERERDVLVMEHVEGRTLSQRIADKTLSVARAKSITRDLLRGLDAIHAAGVLHRDLKPSNVIVQDDDHVIIIDFGFARDEQRASVQASAVLVGTPVYWAPELTAGKKASVASDLYSVGRIALEMYESVRDPVTDAQFRGWIERCLHPFPERRFESAQVALGALDASRRNRNAAMFAGASVLFCVVVAAAFAFRPRATPPEAQRFVATPRAAVVAASVVEASIAAATVSILDAGVIVSSASAIASDASTTPSSSQRKHRRPRGPVIDDVLIEQHPRPH
jgi:predicted Ser/Thr protein kinase